MKPLCILMTDERKRERERERERERIIPAVLRKPI
jgi:hypothetical protein